MPVDGYGGRASESYEGGGGWRREGSAVAAPYAYAPVLAPGPP
jgi:hypothetical protein